MKASNFLEITNKKFSVITDISASFNLLFSAPPLVIIGSAISCMPPTSKPAGQSISHEIVELLLEKNKESITPKTAPLYFKAVSELGWSVLFEQCFERAPNIEALRSVINYFFINAQPNKYHEILARALINGLISGIITTNYDNCLDKCFDASTENSVLRISDEKDSLAASINKKLYFIIHGSCGKSVGSSICLALSDETELANWKK